MTIKLGLAIGYSGAHLNVPVALVQRAEELGYDSVWSTEAYGSDAITPLAFLAAKTSRIKLGTGIMQLAARTPANAAMSAASGAAKAFLKRPAPAIASMHQPEAIEVMAKAARLN
jgi:Luciferase-like monooxygenase